MIAREIFIAGLDGAVSDDDWRRLKTTAPAYGLTMPELASLFAQAIGQVFATILDGNVRPGQERFHGTPDEDVTPQARRYRRLIRMGLCGHCAAPLNGQRSTCESCYLATATRAGIRHPFKNRDRRESRRWVNGHANHERDSGHELR